MAKKKSSPLMLTLLALFGTGICAFGIYKGFEYINPITATPPDTTSSSETPPLMNYPVNIYVDGILSNGSIIFDDVGDTHIVEIKQKETNTFYEKKVEIQVSPSSRADSFEFIDLNGDDLYVKFQAKLIKGVFEPTKIYLSSPDFNLYVKMHTIPDKATGITISGGTTIYK